MRQQLKLLTMSDIHAEQVRWLWEPYLPRGKITIIQGDPGDGKTTFVLALAAVLSGLTVFAAGYRPARAAEAVSPVEALGYRPVQSGKRSRRTGKGGILWRLAKEQLTKDKNIIVIPTKTVPQGITAIINYVPDISVEENEAVMTEEVQRVATGQVTYAVRDTMIDNQEIHQGDFMGIGDKGILAVGTDLQSVAFNMVQKMMSDEFELISIYYGDVITEEQAQRLADQVQAEYSGCDVELQFGGQPIYSYIISAE